MFSHLLAPLLLCQVLSGQVAGVVDGNTIELKGEQKTIRVQLAGIDAPEIGQPFGDQAKAKLAKLLEGKSVTVREVKEGPSGVCIGTVFEGKTNLNRFLVSEGFAWHVSNGEKGDLAQTRKFVQAQAEAKEKGRGLWVDEKPTPPWQWRKKHPSQAKVNPKLAKKADATSNAEEKKNEEGEGKYWLTTSSGVRHKSSCRWYKKSKGRFCKPDEGRPCKQCGG